jgi:LysM repeat protein
MKKNPFLSILIFAILLSISCKSKAPPRTDITQPVSSSTSSSNSSSTPSSTSSSTSTPAVTPPSSTTAPSALQPSTATETNIGSRHQSGIILDGAVSYTVKRGDTLSGIARQIYRDGSYYPLIMMVSNGISDIDKIYPNMRLTIPNLRANLNDPTAKANINSYFLQIANLEEQRGRIRTAALIRNHTK